MFPSIGLSPDDLLGLFPFHIIFDRDFQVLQNGTGWLGGKVTVEPGTRLSEVFRCVRPTSGWNFDRFRLEPRSVFVLKAQSQPLTLRGGMRYLPEHDALLFLGSPWITQMAELDALHLNLNDFPPHDALPDLLFLLQAQQSSVRELTVLTGELTEAKEAAEKALKVKDEFIANMSHELLTPLNGILGMAELAVGTSLSSEQAYCVETIQSSAHLLSTLVKDVLDFSNIEAGKLVLESVDFNVRRMLRETLQPLRSYADRKGLQLICEIDPNVPAMAQGDPVRLRQVLTKLVGNAIRFTECGEVSIHVSRMVRSPARWTFQADVRDTGIGIASDKLESIFHPFTQADGSHTRKYGGIGLGLSISRRLAEAMNGCIAAYSRPGGGSRFVFTVLLNEVPSSGTVTILPNKIKVVGVPALPGKGSASQPPLEAIKPLRILLAEDNPVNQQVAVRLLTRSGHSVRVAEDGRKAVEAWEDEPFDLVLMDLQMPGMSGCEATEEIRKRERAGRRTPILAVTANVSDGAKEECLRAGMNGYVPKPIKAAELWLEVSHVLGGGLMSPPLAECPPRGAG